ncbi:hypothetical protein [Microvirga flavescens]|uniref:hypothetical protein n=1 Tax=Microvirga flavescens TaxID=2249811 RepID=UPI000DD64789|nr:hypothetical protein [Microvirga flavescens]
MRTPFRSSVCALAILAGMGGLAFEPPLLRNVTSEFGSGRIAIGSVRAPLWSAALAQSADTFTLENVTLAIGSTTYRAKQIGFSGVSSPRADIEAIFDGQATTPMAERLKRLNAKQIVIPELVVEQKLAGFAQRTIYRNIVASNVTQGRIATIAAETAMQEITQKSGVDTFTQGPSTIAELDLAAMARLYLEKATSPNEPLTKIYGDFSISDAVLTGSNGSVARIAKITGRDFTARPTEDSWSGTLSLLTALSETDKVAKEDQGRLASSLADLLSAMNIGFVEASGIDITDRTKDGGNVRINRAAYTSASNGQPADMRIEGMLFTADDGQAKIDTISFTGFSFEPTLNGLRALRSKPLEEFDATTLRSLVPTIGTVRISGLAIEARGKAEKNKKPDPIKASVEEIELTADKPMNGVATNVRFGIKHYAMALPAGSKEEGIKDLLDLGYKDIDLSFLISSAWDEARNQIEIRDLFFDGKDIGQVSLRGTLGNVSKDVFHADTAVASVALLAAKAKSVELFIENKGLFDRYIAKEAKDQKTKPEAVRRNYGMAAAVLVPSLIGNSQKAQLLSQTIAKFIAKPGRLTIKAQAKDPAGLSVVELAAQTEPAAVLDKLDISAKAE